MLILDHISVSFGEKSIVSDFSAVFSEGQVYALLGKNGSGKSSLAYALMGHPRYTLSGSCTFNGHDIAGATSDAIFHSGIYLSSQSVPEIPGVSLFEYLRQVYKGYFERVRQTEKFPTPFVFRRMLEKLMSEYGIGIEFLERDLFVGFSGGEKRRIEMLQIALLDPKCIILDEIDSGLDIQALSLLSKQIAVWRSMAKVVIVISHNFHLLDDIEADHVLILKDGILDRSGDRELIDSVRQQGF